MTNPRWYDRIRLEHIVIALCTITSVTLTFTPHAPPGSLEDKLNAAFQLAAIVGIGSGFAIVRLHRELRKELAELKQDLPGATDGTTQHPTSKEDTQ